MEKEIIILAKSYKPGGFCIAGIDINTGEWIRPISENKKFEGSVPKDDIEYENRNEVQILDKVKIQIKSHQPSKAQPENYIYDSKYYWEKTGVSSLDEVIQIRGFDKPDKIFYNTSTSVTENEIGGENSLLLIEVENSEIFIKTFSDNSRKVQFNFEYNRNRYTYFKITDIDILEEFKGNTDGNYNCRRKLVVVFSLTDVYQRTQKYYKVVPQLFY